MSKTITPRISMDLHYSNDIPLPVPLEVLEQVLQACHEMHGQLEETVRDWAESYRITFEGYMYTSGHLETKMSLTAYFNVQGEEKIGVTTEKHLSPLNTDGKTNTLGASLTSEVLSVLLPRLSKRRVALELRSRELSHVEATHS